jgi:hypothetical protein
MAQPESGLFLHGAVQRESSNHSHTKAFSKNFEGDYYYFDCV